MINFFRFIAFISFLFISVPIAQAAGPQIFIDADNAVVSQSCSIDVLILDDIGRVDENFSGAKAFTVDVKEVNGIENQSYQIETSQIKFDRGIGKIIIHDKEVEDLELMITIEGIPIAGKGTISFEDKTGEKNPEESISYEEELKPDPNADKLAPRIIRAHIETVDMVLLEFDEEIDDDQALKEQNYLAVTNRREAHPESIEYHRDYVNLFFDQHFMREEEGHIEITDIEDVYGNRVEDGLKSPEIRGVDCEDLCND